MFFQTFLKSHLFTFMNWIKIQFQVDSQHPLIIGIMLVTSAYILMTIHQLLIMTKSVITTKMKPQKLTQFAQKQSELFYLIWIDSCIFNKIACTGGLKVLSNLCTLISRLCIELCKTNKQLRTSYFIMISHFYDLVFQVQ